MNKIKKLNFNFHKLFFYKLLNKNNFIIFINLRNLNKKFNFLENGFNIYKINLFFQKNIELKFLN